MAMIRPGLPGGRPGAIDERPIFPACALVHLARLCTWACRGRRRRYERSNVLVTGGGTGQRNRYALSLLCDRQILQEASTGQGWLLPDLAGQDVDTQVKALRQHILSLRWKYDDVERRLRISEVSRILRRGDFLYFHCFDVPSRFRFVCATKALTLLACN